jgi:hypothetical protein
MGTFNFLVAFLAHYIGFSVACLVVSHAALHAVYEGFTLNLGIFAFMAFVIS